MRALALTLLAVVIVLSGGCGTTMVRIALPDLDDATEALGYSLAPNRMPEGFEFEYYDVPEIPELLPPSELVPYAILYYERYENYAYHNIIIQYPQSFPPSVSDDALLESLGIEWHRPNDAVSEVKVNGKTAYLVRGSWSAESFNMLTSLDAEALATYIPIWDYDIYLSLYFDFELSQEETVVVMIMALLYPEDWITSGEMVRIAESFQCVD